MGARKLGTYATSGKRDNSLLTVYALKIQLNSITHLLGKEGSKVMIENNFLEKNFIDICSKSKIIPDSNVKNELT